MTLRSTRSPSVVRTKNSYSYISSPCLNTVKLHTVDVIYMIARNSWNRDANEMDRCSPFYNARLPLCFLAKFLHPFEMRGILKPRYVLESCIIAQEEARFLKKTVGVVFRQGGSSQPHADCAAGPSLDPRRCIPRPRLSRVPIRDWNQIV